MKRTFLTRRHLLRIAILLGVVLIAFLSSTRLDADDGAKPRPNLIFILSDDQLRGNFGCYGSEEGLTPNIDRLAAQG